MSFMFKGPAALTAGSTIPAASINSALSGDTDLTIGDDLTVGDNLTVTGDLTVSGTVGLTVSGTGGISVSGNGGLTVSGTGDLTVSGTGGITVSGTGGITVSSADGLTVTNGPIDEYVVEINNGTTTIDISKCNVLYLASTSPNNATVNINLTWPTVKNGHRVFIALLARGPSNTATQLDFGQIGRLYVTGTTGPTVHRYLILNGIGTNTLIYYSTTKNMWMTIESNAAVPL